MGYLTKLATGAQRTAADYIETEAAPQLIAAADELEAKGSAKDLISWLEAYAVVAGVADEELADKAADLLTRRRDEIGAVRDRLSPYAHAQLGALVEGWEAAQPPAEPYSSAAFADAPAQIRFVGASRFTSARGYPVIQGRMTVMGGSGIAGDFLVNTGGGAASHTRTNGPIPPGRYWVSNYRVRDKTGFVLNGVGFSLDVDPTPETPVFGRSLFRIHPDGASEGTNGCLGLRESAASLRAAAALLKALVAQGPALLTVTY